MNDKASTIICLAQEHLGDPYVYGAWGSPCTPELRRKYARLNPSHAGNITKRCQVLNGGGTSCTGCKWQGALAYDCRGFTHWLLKQVGIEIAGGGATSQYNTISNWAVRGKIADMPDVVCCLFRQSGGLGALVNRVDKHFSLDFLRFAARPVVKGNASGR